MDDIEMRSSYDISTASTTLTMHLSDRAVRDAFADVLEQAKRVAVAKIAARIVEECGDAVLAQVNVQALANFATAQAGLAIAKSLSERPRGPSREDPV